MRQTHRIAKFRSLTTRMSPYIGAKPANYARRLQFPNASNELLTMLTQE